VSDLIIPNHQYGNTLSQVLQVILLKCDRENQYNNESILLDEVHYLEKQLIQKNLSYWKDFQRLILKQFKATIDTNAATIDVLQCLSDCCIEHIKNYVEFKSH
jgi:hypothetical protein